jgi:hypothetical protein
VTMNEEPYDKFLERMDAEVEPKTEWNIGGIKVTMTAEPNESDPIEEFRSVDYVFRMDGYRADVLQGFEALEKVVWLNKLEREQ